MTRAGEGGEGPRTSAQEARAQGGLAYALSAFGLWGLSPAYWKGLAHIGPFEVLAHRVVWSLLLLSAWMVRGERLQTLFQALKGWRIRAALGATTLLIGFNWMTFIWAVTNDRVLQASLGYFMTPLISVALGFLVLKETMNRVQWMAVALAATGVVVLGVSSQVSPWVSLSLALSFGLYGLIRKAVPVGALEGLFAETMACLPLAVGFLIWLAWQGKGAFGSGDLLTHAMLVVGGPVTTVPLLLFALAARRMRLSTLGLTQYLAPTIQFLLAVFVYGETLTTAHIATFALIWTGLGLFTWDSFRRDLRAVTRVSLPRAVGARRSS